MDLYSLLTMFNLSTKQPNILNAINCTQSLFVKDTNKKEMAFRLEQMHIR